jgi:CheY-like chemotaxis protein
MGEKLRILHLEDSREDRDLTQRELIRSRLPHEITFATTAMEFFAAIDAGRFDVVLSDSGVVGLEGKAALAMARGRNPRICFIFLTGHSPGPAIDDLLDAGADAVVPKDQIRSLAPTILQATGRTPEEPPAM